MKNEDYTLFPIPTKLLDLMGIDTTAALRVAADADGKLTVIKGAQQTELEDITIDDLPEENTDECETGCARCEYWCPRCKRCLLDDDTEGDWDGKRNPTECWDRKVAPPSRFSSGCGLDYGAEMCCPLPRKTAR